ncbi:glycosyltransferase family 4 protein [Hyphomicrobiales bacterium 4NK60-0047b]
MTPKKLLFLLSEDWFVCSHFLDRAVAAKAAGYDVVIVANENKHGDQIRNQGLRFVPLSYDRGGINIFKELHFLYKIFRLYKVEKPDIVHQISAKPIFYGSFIARLLKVPAIVNAPIGLGYVFSSNEVKAKILKPFIKFAYKLFLNRGNSKAIFENSDDLNYFVDMKALKAKDAVLIKGAGVDMQEFKPVSKSGVPTIVLIARMLRDKGIEEFVEAAKNILSQNGKARFLLVGGLDEVNPTSFTEQQLTEWSAIDGINWLGKRNDVSELLKQSDIACLPSYREGLPKSLIEAAASGLPIVTTDTVGCREVVEDGENGFLVPIKTVEPLAKALMKLIENETLRQTMGEKSRKRAEQEFANELVIEQTLKVYTSL